MNLDRDKQTSATTTHPNLSHGCNNKLWTSIEFDGTDNIITDRVLVSFHFTHFCLWLAVYLTYEPSTAMPSRSKRGRHSNGIFDIITLYVCISCIILLKMFTACNVCASCLISSVCRMPNDVFFITDNLSQTIK